MKKLTKAEKTLHEALLFDGLEESQVPFEELKKAMCQHAIEFAEWIIEQGWQVHLKKDKWYKRPHHIGDEHLTTEQLYDKFNSDHQQVERSCKTCNSSELGCTLCNIMTYSNWKPRNNQEP